MLGQLLSFEPTYKELKHLIVKASIDSRKCFEPTYKELKLNLIWLVV